MIEKNICKWITNKYSKQKYKESINNILKNQSISVELWNKISDDELKIDTHYVKTNKIISIIICYCGVHTKVFKKVLSGRKKKTLILNNYYRHNVNHKKKKMNKTNT